MIERKNDSILDNLESVLLDSSELVDCPVVHRFTNNMYIRQIFMPKGTLLTSKIHNTEHPFTVSHGAAAVSIDGDDWQHIVSPYTGITKPGTRRILYILEDCIWTTYHIIEGMKSEFNELSDEEIEDIVSKIEDKIIVSRSNSITGTNINNDYKNILKDNNVVKQLNND